MEVKIRSYCPVIVAFGMLEGLELFTGVEEFMLPHPARNARLTIPKITSVLVASALLFIARARIVD